MEDFLRNIVMLKKLFTESSLFFEKPREPRKIYFRLDSGENHCTTHGQQVIPAPASLSHFCHVVKEEEVEEVEEKQNTDVLFRFSFLFNTMFHVELRLIYIYKRPHKR